MAGVLSPNRSTVPQDYYSGERPEILALVPWSASHVLELGCAEGGLGLSIKRRQGARVVGLEYSSNAAQVARGRLDEVIQADIDEYAFDWPPGTFDCIVAGDVIEHLKDPWRTLDHLRRILQPNGHLIVSIPNAANLRILHQLATGWFNYEDAGLLDRTHLRFFTRKTFEQALMSAGFMVVLVDPIYDPIYHTLPETVRTQGGQVSLPSIRIECPDAQALNDIMAYQLLFVGTPSPLPS